MQIAQSALRGECVTEEARNVIRRQTLQDKDAAARQESTVDLKRGILRRRPDEDNAALLHKR